MGCGKTTCRTQTRSDPVRIRRTGFSDPNGSKSPICHGDWLEGAVGPRQSGASTRAPRRGELFGGRRPPNCEFPDMLFLLLQFFRFSGSTGSGNLEILADSERACQDSQFDILFVKSKKKIRFSIRFSPFSGSTGSENPEILADFKRACPDG